VDLHPVAIAAVDVPVGIIVVEVSTPSIAEVDDRAAAAARLEHLGIEHRAARHVVIPAEGVDREGCEFARDRPDRVSVARDFDSLPVAGRLDRHVGRRGVEGLLEALPDRLGGLHDLAVGFAQ
jgi:hypothetical protein